MSAIDELRGIIEIIAQRKLGLDDDGYILAWERRWRMNIVLQQLISDAEAELGNDFIEKKNQSGWQEIGYKLYVKREEFGVKEPQKIATEIGAFEMRHVLSILRDKPLDESEESV